MTIVWFLLLVTIEPDQPLKLTKQAEMSTYKSCDQEAKTLGDNHICLTPQQIQVLQDLYDFKYYTHSTGL